MRIMVQTRFMQIKGRFSIVYIHGKAVLTPFRYREIADDLHHSVLADVSMIKPLPVTGIIRVRAIIMSSVPLH